VPTELPQSPFPSREPGPAAERAHKAVGALAEYATAIAQDRDDSAARDEARVALFHYIEELKSEHVAPERALITVKVVARSLASGLSMRAREALVDETVRWCVAAYYGTPPAPAGHRVGRA
jgi:hypothetical protein